MRSVLPFALLIIVAASAAAQDNRLLYTVLYENGERLSNPCPGNLARLEPNEVGLVKPVPVLPAEGLKFAPRVAWNTVVGDENADGDYFEAGLFGKIDALQMRAGTLQQTKDMRRLFFSVSGGIGPAVSGFNVRPADIVRVVPLGEMDIFLEAGQIASAFGISSALIPVLNVDALAVKFPDGADPGAVYLSFEEDQFINVTAGAYLVEDGAILCIPGTAIVWSPDLTVAAVAKGAGEIALMEIDVGLCTDRVVDNSGVADFHGDHPTAIKDLDGLAIDGEQGGTFQGMMGVYHNLILCGETLTGGGILSTAVNAAGTHGSIAEINGAPLASMAPNPTNGEQVGISDPKFVGSLNGLFSGSRYMISYVIDTDFPEPPLPALQVRIGSEIPGAGFHYLLIAPGPPPGYPGLVASSLYYPNPGFPNLYSLYVLCAVPVDSSGLWIYPSILPPGMNLIFQAGCVKPAGVFLSTPGTITL